MRNPAEPGPGNPAFRKLHAGYENYPNHKNHKNQSMVTANTEQTDIRHRWPDRLFHWTMALTVLILLFSAFLPIVGIQFDWIPWHWISGVCLTVLVLFHIVRAIAVQGLSQMLPGVDDLREVGRDLGGGSDHSSRALSAAKYDTYQKSYHWMAALTVLALVITGVLMLLKLDTTFWQRNPAILSDIQWGYVYVIHGIFSLLLIFLVILHIYFSVLPEHKTLLLSMITGRGPQYTRGGEPQP
jgi:cytochrome b subunit of formate dehydrogenase